MAKARTREEPVKGKRQSARQGRTPLFTPGQLAGQEELHKAYTRIGTSPKAWMQWILKFADCDLGALSAGGWMDLRYEVALFTFVGPPEAWKIGHFIVAPTQWGHMHHGSFQHCVLPTSEEVEQCQAITNQHLAQLLQLGSTHFPPFLGTMVVSDTTQVHLGPLAVSPETRLLSFLHGLACSLAIHAAGIRRCSGCQTRFLANRRDQHFCSVRCLSRFNMRKYRGTPPERIGKRGRPPKRDRHLAKRT